MSKKIAVGFDGSDGSWRALKEAARLAVLEKAVLYVISIEEIQRYPSTIGEVIEEQETSETHFHKLHNEAVEIAKGVGMNVEDIKTHIKIGHPAKGLIEYVGEITAYLLVLGHTGHSGVWGTFLGTTADKVVRHAPCSVYVVR